MPSMSPWEQIHASMKARAVGARGRQDFVEIASALNGVVAAATPEDLIAFFHAKRQDQDAKQRAYRILVDSVQSGARGDETALALIWLGLSPGLTRRYQCLDSKRRKELGDVFLAAFYDTVRRVNADESGALAATIILNTFRRAIAAVDEEFGARDDIYRRRERAEPAASTDEDRERILGGDDERELYDKATPAREYGELGTTPTMSLEAQYELVARFIREAKPEWADLLIEAILDGKKPSSLVRKYELDERSIRKRLEAFQPIMRRHLRLKGIDVSHLRRNLARLFAEREKRRRAKTESAQQAA